MQRAFVFVRFIQETLPEKLTIPAGSHALLYCRFETGLQAFDFYVDAEIPFFGSGFDFCFCRDDSGPSEYGYG